MGFYLRFVCTVMLCVSAPAFFTGCGKKKPAEESSLPESAVACVRDSKSYSELRACYSAGTLAEAESLVRKGLITKEKLFSVLKIADTGDKWICPPPEMSDETAIIDVRFTRHSSQNIVGMPVRLRAVFENGSWKLDLSGDISTPAGGDSTVNEYVRKTFSKY